MQALTLIMLSSSTSLNNSILENTDYFPAALSKLRSAAQLFKRPSKHFGEYCVLQPSQS